ncbi:hypothetical protein EDC04DRAFT_561171 [Pisolithus marmoratus]|nr:hypothetical protein EDC04DRAFT_561171 [Pisolithus marmoratus]
MCLPRLCFSLLLSALNRDGDPTHVQHKRTLCVLGLHACALPRNRWREWSGGDTLVAHVHRFFLSGEGSTSCMAPRSFSLDERADKPPLVNNSLVPAVNAF